MSRKNVTMNYLIIGILVVVLSILSGIIVMLIFLAPTVLLYLAGLPLWPLLLISIPIGFVVLGWAILVVGKFRRR